MQYIIMNDDESKFATHDGYMYPVNAGGKAAFSTVVKGTAEKWIETWKRKMLNCGVQPYNLKIVERE